MAYIPKPRWTQRQVNFLIDNAYVLKDEEIATILGKTLKSVRRRRERLQIMKACGRGYVKPAPIKNRNPNIENTNNGQAQI